MMKWGLDALWPAAAAAVDDDDSVCRKHYLPGCVYIHVCILYQYATPSLQRRYLIVVFGVNIYTACVCVLHSQW